MKSRFWLLGLVAALACVLGFWSFTPRHGVMVLIKIGYGVTLFTSVLFVVYLYKVSEWAALWRKFLAGGWRICLLVLGLSVFLHLHEKHEYKVVMDEVVLMATSQGMYKERDATYSARGYTIGPDFHILQRQMDKRPLFFPFLISAVHDLTGYRTTNSFWLNFVLTPVLLGLIYAVSRRVAGAEAGVAAVLLWATVPLFIHCAAGGGFEILNLVMIAGTVLLGMRYAERPTGSGLAAFCLSGVLLSQVRYESVIFVIPVGIVVLMTWWRKRPEELPGAVIATPLLMVPYALHRYVFTLNPQMWQLADRPSDHGSFSFQYFYDNVGHALNHFFTFDFSQPSSPLLAFLGLAALGFFPLWLWRKYRDVYSEDPARGAFVVFCGSLLGLSVLMLCYFWGAFDDPLTTRLSLPTQLLFVWLIVLLGPEFIKGRRAVWSVLSLMAVSALLLWTLPVLSKRVYASDRTAAHMANWANDFARRHPGIERSLVVDSRAVIVWLTNNVASVTHGTVMGSTDRFLFHYRHATFTEILVVQRCRPKSLNGGEWQPYVGDDLGPGVQLEAVEQILMGPSVLARISRVVAIDEQEFRASAAGYAERVKADEKIGDDLVAAQLFQKEMNEKWTKMLP